MTSFINQYCVVVNAPSFCGENNVHAKPLVEALKAARAKSPVPPVSERLTSCWNFLERARKRVTRAEDLIARAVEQKTVFMQEVAEAAPPSELQRRIEELVRERDALRVPMQGVWCADGPPSDAIPPMPSADLQELQGYLSERNCELRNALEFGYTSVTGRHVQINSDVGNEQRTKNLKTKIKLQKIKNSILKTITDYIF